MSAQRQSRDLLSLPVELLVEIFNLIKAPTDRLSVCLVSKKACEIMLPLLYQSVTVTIPHSLNGEPLSSLLSHSNKGPAHIRHLTIEKADTSSLLLAAMDIQAAYANNVVFILIGALPRDGLRSLRLGSDVREKRNLCNFLADRQRSLEHVSMPSLCDDDVFSDLHGCTQLRRMRSRLTSLRLQATEQENSTEPRAGEYCCEPLPRLKALYLDLSYVGEYFGPANREDCATVNATYFGRFLRHNEARQSHHHDVGEPVGAGFSNLQRLHLKAACPGTLAVSALSRAFDFTKPKCLVLERCMWVTPLLSALADAEDLSLEVLIVQTAGQSPTGAAASAATRVFEQLLTSFMRLKSLVLHVTGDSEHPIVQLAAVAHHKATLRTLALEFGDAKVSRWSAATIAELTRACTSLRQLSLALPPVPLSAHVPSPKASLVLEGDEEPSPYSYMAFFLALRHLSSLQHLVTLHFRRLPTTSHGTTQYPEFLNTLRTGEIHVLRHLTETCLLNIFATCRLEVIAWGGSHILSLVERSVRRGDGIDREGVCETVCFTRAIIIDQRRRKHLTAIHTEETQLKYFEPEVDVLGLAGKQV